MSKKLPFKNKIILAPMEEVNDIAFRILCKNCGAGATYTGMISPFYPKEISLQDKPALQLFCTTEKGIKEFIKKYDKKVLLWDFNLGCPAQTAKKSGFGAYLQDLEIIEKILKIIRTATKKPVTIKLRKSKNTMKIARLAKQIGIDAITIHPRTKEQGYGGEPDIEFAKKLKKQIKLPIIYSGNVNENNYKELLKEFDYVMVGRAAMGNPNIFAKIQNKKTRVNFQDYLALAKKHKLPFKQIKFQAMQFTKGQLHSRELRDKISKMKSEKELIPILKNFF